jgi:diguanylate cyclase (GGDEF)-like protein
VLPGSRRWIGVAVGLVLLQIAATAALRPGNALAQFSDVLLAAQFLVLLLIFVANAVATRGRLRSVWTLLAASWAFWLADECAWIFYDFVLRKPMPDMFPGDVLLFLAGVPVLGALLLRPHVESSDPDSQMGTLDFFQLMLWWIYLYADLVMCWQYVRRDAPLYNRNFDRLYWLEFIVLAISASALIKLTAGAWRRFYALLLAAVVLTYLSVIAQNRAIEAGVYYVGGWYDIPFVLSLLVFLLVALRGRSLVPIPATNVDKTYVSQMSGLAALAVLSLPILAMYAVLDRSMPMEITRFRVLITSGAILAMSGLLFIRQRQLTLDLKKTNAVLEHASITDPLTGIRNRRFFAEMIDADVARTLRAFASDPGPASQDLIFYLVDIDNFKEVNDRFGHGSGDRVLIDVAHRIGSVMRASDVLLRWGGEEFLIVSRFADRRQADALALRVMHAIRQEPFVILDSVCVWRTCSIGWAAYPWQEENATAVGYEQVLHYADEALNQAKGSGKDRAVGMTPFQGGTIPQVRICDEPMGDGDPVPQDTNSP